MSGSDGNVVKIMEDAIKEQLSRYSEQLHSELTEKYKKEFEERLREHRRKVVLEVAEMVRIQHSFEPHNRQSVVQIRLG